jgi:hypothetical protein
VPASLAACALEPARLAFIAERNEECLVGNSRSDEVQFATLE